MIYIIYYVLKQRHWIVLYSNMPEQSEPHQRASWRETFRGAVVRIQV